MYFLCTIAELLLLARYFGRQGIFGTKTEWLILLIKVGIKAPSRAILSFHLIKFTLEPSKLKRLPCLG